VITAMFAQLVATAGRTSQLLSCDDHGRLYAATTDTVSCADTRNMSRDLQVSLLSSCFDQSAVPRLP